LTTGSDKTLINTRALPKGTKPSVNKGARFAGIHGTELLDKEVMLRNISLSEFSPTQKIAGPVRATLFDNSQSSYDVIVGMDLMQAVGINISCTTKTVSWNDNTIPFHPSDYFGSTFPISLAEAMYVIEAEEQEAAALGYKSKTILHSKYEAINTEEVAEQQKHLSQRQRKDLAKILGKYTKLFSGKLGCYPHRKVHLELVKDAKPTTCRPYPVPRHHQQVFKDELKRLCDEGVLSPCGASAWLSPSFCIPKKDGRIRFISNFRSLNKLIKRKVYNLPKDT
jgi:hypothetical protein